MIKRLISVLTFFLLVSAYASAQTPALTLPDFNFYKFDKSSFTNKNLETGKLLFFFYFDCDCEHCQHAMMNLNGHYDDYKKAAIYLVSIDSQDKIKEFMSKYAGKLNGNKNVTVLLDTKNEFESKFTPIRYPSMFLYSPEKKLLDYEDNEESMFRFSKQINGTVKKN